MNSRTHTTTFSRTALVVAIGLCAAFSLTAVAGERHRGARHTAPFEQIDSNKDGMLTQAEVDNYRAERAASMDTNGDGVVSFEEADAKRAAKHEERARARFAKQDQNGDGVLSVDEIGNRASTMFQRLDADADGVVSAEEMASGKRGHHHGKRHHQRAESE